MRFICYGWLAFLLLFSPLGFAYYCSSQAGSGFISVGDTIAQVEDACGTPSQKTQNVPGKPSITTVQYWMYDNVDTTVLPTRSISRKDNELNVDQTAPIVVVELTNGTVTRVTSNNQATDDTTCRKNGIVSVGDSVEQLIQNCGKPDARNFSQATEDASVSQSEEWHYNRGEFSSPIKLQFENGTLKNISE